MQVIGNAPGLGNFRYGAHATVDLSNAKVLEDVCFSWSKRFTVGVSGTVNIIIDPTNISADKDSIVLPTFFGAYGAGPLFIDMYFGAVFTGGTGTVWAGGNRDNTSSSTPATIVTFDPTVTNDGVKTPFEFTVFSDGISAVSKAGGQSKEDLIFKARKDGNYMFRIVNQEAAVAYAQFALTVFEV